MEWARILAYITGTVDQELLLWNEYLLAENRILKAQLPGRPRLSDAERATLGEIGHRLGRKALSEVATAATPDTILAWYRKLVARKFDGSRARRAPGRPPINPDLEDLIVRMAKENRSWGYDRREPQSYYCRHHRSSERAMDAANGPECDHGGMRHPSRLSLSFA